MSMKKKKCGPLMAPLTYTKRLVRLYDRRWRHRQDLSMLIGQASVESSRTREQLRTPLIRLTVSIATFVRPAVFKGLQRPGASHL